MNIETIITDTKDWDNLNPKITNENNMYIEIVEQLIKKRINLGLSQRDLARLCGLKQPAIARIESFKSVPTINTVYKISKALGYNIHINFEPIH